MVATFMLRHVDERKGSLGRVQGALDDGVGTADEGVDRPVSGLSGIDVQQGHPGGGSHGIGDGLDNLPIPAF